MRNKEDWNRGYISMKLLSAISYETSQGKGVRGNDAKYGCDVPAEIKALNLPNYPNSLCPWKR